MKQPIAHTPEEIVDATEALLQGDVVYTEEELVATFHAAPRDVQEHVLEALGAVRRRAGQ